MPEFSQALIEVEEHREEVIEKLLQYSLTDTLVFWGSEKELIEKQKKLWEPILKWANENIMADIKKTHSLEVPEENLKTGHKIKRFLENLSNKELTAFYKAALLMRSVLLAMAFVKRKVNAKEAFEAALLEEKWQNGIWGATDETIKNQEFFLQELVEIEAFLDRK